MNRVFYRKHTHTYHSLSLWLFSCRSCCHYRIVALIWPVLWWHLQKKYNKYWAFFPFKVNSRLEKRNHFFKYKRLNPGHKFLSSTVCPEINSSLASIWSSLFLFFLLISLWTSSDRFLTSSRQPRGPHSSFGSAVGPHSTFEVDGFLWLGLRDAICFQSRKWARCYFKGWWDDNNEWKGWDVTGVSVVINLSRMSAG